MSVLLTGEETWRGKHAMPPDLKNDGQECLSYLLLSYYLIRIIFFVDTFPLDSKRTIYNPEAIFAALTLKV